LLIFWEKIALNCITKLKGKLPPPKEEKKKKYQPLVLGKIPQNL
jgi:hypothetical protein